MSTNFRFTLPIVLLVAAFLPEQTIASQPRPNILWITCEDISPWLGCYGDPQAHTPHIDQLAAEGLRFTRAYANAPVCAVARSTLLTGVNSAAIGTHHMRSRMVLPPEIPAAPKILRQAGYHTYNNSKKDYNSNYETDRSIWDESSQKAHWRQRPTDKPFFAVFNLEMTHESRLDPKLIAALVANGTLPKSPRVAPSTIIPPPFHPDLPAIRNDWARLHDLVTLMDTRVGQILQQLEADGLADDTIVFFFSDHGGMLAGTKRFIRASGTRVPLIIRVPEKWRHLAPVSPATSDDGLVTFADLPMTVLSLAGVTPPPIMQGRILLGAAASPPPATLHFTRDRMSERPDFSRAVTDGRHTFTRHFMPHRPPGRCTRYGPTVQENWRAWENHFDQGLCNPIQSQFYLPKPPIELHDLLADPWQVRNLSSNPELRETADQLSAELDRWMIEIRDTGLIPEAMFHQLTGPATPHATLYDYAQSRADYPVERILAVAKAAPTATVDEISSWLTDPHPVIRYWGGYAAFLSSPSNPAIESALTAMAEDDQMKANRIMAAQALAAHGGTAADTAFRVLMREVKSPGDGYVLLYALNAIQVSGLDARLTREDWRAIEGPAQKPPVGKDPTGFECSNRIIQDALTLWPKRRIIR